MGCYLLGGTCSSLLEMSAYVVVDVVSLSKNIRSKLYILKVKTFYSFLPISQKILAGETSSTSQVIQITHKKYEV